MSSKDQIAELELSLRRLQIRMDALLYHLPGQHPQKRHGRRGGAQKEDPANVLTKDENIFLGGIKPGTPLWKSLLSEHNKILKRNPGLASLRPAESFALGNYTVGFRQINGALRGEKMGQKRKNIALAQARIMNKALNKLPSFRGKVFRGAVLTEPKLRQFKEGTIITDPAFVSSSVSRAVAEGDVFSIGKKGRFVLFEIISKKGKDIRTLSELPSQKEVLFSFGSRFRVDNVAPTKIKLTEV